MDNSVYVALSKQIGTARQLNVVANNIANINTTGFKAEQMVFQSYLVDDAQNRQTAYAQDISTVRDTSQGSLEQTDNPLDLAIQGNGYFAIQTDQGVRYSRAGNFTINQNAQLSTQDGNPVLDDSQSPIEFEETDVQIEVFGDGRLLVDGEERSTVGVFQFDNEHGMESVGNGLFESEEIPLINEGEAKLAQGMIENSNVISVKQITEMIQLQRRYTGSAKFINNMYELQETAIRQLARQG